MTSVQSLTACAASDVPWDRGLALVEQPQPDSLTLEFKREYSSGLVKTVAAMANSYGDLILVGIADVEHATQDPGGNRLVGVPGETTTQIANGCNNAIEPPWQPEIIEVAVPGAHDTFVLVVRVDPARAPRPLLVEGKAPIRLHGNNATAGRGRLAQLFAEQSAPLGRGRRALPRPDLPREPDGTPKVDYIMRCGMQIPIEGAASWRLLPERGIDDLAAALETSAPTASAAEMVRRPADQRPHPVPPPRLQPSPSSTSGLAAVG